MNFREERTTDLIRGLNLYDLNIDQAYLNVSSRNINNIIWLYYQKAACYLCPYELYGPLKPNTDEIITLSSKYTWNFRILNKEYGKFISQYNTSSLLCEFNDGLEIGEFGVYDIIIQNDKLSDEGRVLCNEYVVHDPVNIYLPIAFLLLIGLCFGSIFLFVLWIYYRYKNNNKKEMNDEVNTIPLKSKRNVALDGFRGLCLLMLMFYNGGGGGYTIFQHTAWDGLPIAEVPFPWFMWIMGACIPISVNAAIKRNYTRLQIFQGVFVRSLFLFLAGTIITSIELDNQLETFRILGVLQRFGIMCLICGTICTLLWPSNINKINGPNRDLIILLPQWCIHIIIHLIHLILTYTITVPGCPRGYMGPGGLHNDMNHQNCTGGLAGYIDKIILGENHMFPNATCKDLYQTDNFEPEGIFSTLPALLTVMLGIQAGTILIVYPKWKTRVYHWSFWGTLTLVFSVLLHNLNIIPINKNLWTTSFALATAGLAYLSFTILYLLLDVWKFWSGVPLTAMGMNSLIMYLGSKLTTNLWPWHWKYGKMDTHFMLLLDTCWSVGLWILIALILYKRKIFIKF